MSDIWQGATWNENGELVLGIYTEPPTKDIDEEDSEDEPAHTYATIDCGGECGECIALVIDDEVISGPPFHPNCRCELTLEEIDHAERKKSNLHGEVAPNKNVDTRDVKWLKESLEELNCYQPDTRAGESVGNPNPYPNQKLFDAIEKFRKLHKIKERGTVKPGHWTEVKINQELEKKQSEKKDMENIDTNSGIDMNFEQAYNKLKEPEGDYTDGTDQFNDEPTNMGIKQSTLDRYANKHPEKKFPTDVKYLTAAQAKEIYKNEYWNNTKIPRIKNDRMRDAVFDMNVMGDAGRVVQRALNEYSNINLIVDGIIGSKTISALNSIPSNKIDDFMQILIEQRMNNLRGMANWPTSKNGWTKRTKAY